MSKAQAFFLKLVVEIGCRAMRSAFKKRGNGRVESLRAPLERVHYDAHRATKEEM